VSPALDDEDEDFFRAFEMIKLKKNLPARKDSADMNNFYESSLGSTDSRKEAKYDERKKAPTATTDLNNNNDLFHNFNMTDSRSQTSTDEQNLTTTRHRRRQQHDNNNDDESDSFSDDSDDSDAPKKIHLVIKSVDVDKNRVKTSDVVLSQIGKNLKLQTTTNKQLPVLQQQQQSSGSNTVRSRTLSPETPETTTKATSNVVSGINLTKSKLQETNFAKNQSSAPPLPPLPLHLQNKVVPPRPHNHNPKPLSIPSVPVVAAVIAEINDDNISNSPDSGRNLPEYKITDGVIKF
jgi:hypothetical protein